MNKPTMAVVGGGQMGRALVGGMLAGKVITPEGLHVVDPSAESRLWWKEHHSDVQVGDDLKSAVSSADIVLLAVKPNVIPAVTQQHATLLAGKLVVSIAAGISLQQLCDWIGHQRVVRVMPNTPSLVGAGASAYCAANEVTAEDLKQIDAMLASVGIALQVDESQMDAVTGLSGSGPAYVCLIVEALADGGVLAGLSRPVAMKLAAQTVLGTAKMIAQTGRHPGELKDAVASPGGTTIAALKVLEQNGLRGALVEAVAASAKRSKELGN